MKKITIPQDITGKDLYNWLIANKSELIAQKKMGVKTDNETICDPFQTEMKISDIATKAAKDGQEARPDVCHVKVAANTFNWCDFAMDVLMDGCADKTIVDRKNLIPHIQDHIHKSDSDVGDVTDLYIEKISLTDLGLSEKGKTDVLIMESDVQKSYNSKIFHKYRNKRVKQHSIGLQYLKINLCINDEDYKDEFSNWNKYFSRVINKDFVTSKGYFYAVTEIKLLEVSTVLFGCNVLTGTLETDSEKEQPSLTTSEEKPGDTGHKELDFSQFQLI